jgi:hypothetical protein
MFSNKIKGCVCFISPKAGLHFSHAVTAPGNLQLLSKIQQRYVVVLCIYYAVLRKLPGFLMRYRDKTGPISWSTIGKKIVRLEQQAAHTADVDLVPECQGWELLESWTAEQNGQQQPVCNLWALE